MASDNEIAVGTKEKQDANTKAVADNIALKAAGASKVQCPIATQLLIC